MPLPVIATMEQLIPYLDVWRHQLNGLLATSRPPAIPLNFAATPARGAVQLAWAGVDGADGYEVLKAATADMSAAVVIPIGDDAQTALTDTIQLSGATLPTYYYQIRATSGTKLKPHSVRGGLSGVVSAAPLDPTDTVTTPTTTYDTTVSDQTGASRGSYGGSTGRPLGGE